MSDESMKNKHGVHPIILNNKKNWVYWFDKNGNYITAFEGIDGKTYVAEIEPKDWPDYIWERYRTEGISVDGPTPIEDIHFPTETDKT